MYASWLLTQHIVAYWCHLELGVLVNIAWGNGLLPTSSISVMPSPSPNYALQLKGTQILDWDNDMVSLQYGYKDDGLN